MRASGPAIATDAGRASDDATDAALDELDELVANEAPMSTSDLAIDARAKLAALRAEVEGFLDELEDRTDQGEPAE